MIYYHTNDHDHDHVVKYAIFGSVKLYTNLTIFNSVLYLFHANKLQFSQCNILDECLLQKSNFGNPNTGSDDEFIQLIEAYNK